MKIFIWSARESGELHYAIQRHLVANGVSVWMDDADRGETAQQAAARWFAEADLVVVLLTDDCASSPYFLDVGWPAARETRTPVLVLAFGGNIPRDCPDGVAVRVCKESGLAPSLVLDYIRERKRYRLFISYSRRDRGSANYLVSNLKSSLNQVWIDESGLKHGEQFPVRILEAIATCDHLLLLWSRHSRRSRWVEKEWNYAYRNGRSILPVVLDHTPLPMVLEDAHGFSSLDDRNIWKFFDIPDAAMPSRSLWQRVVLACTVSRRTRR